MLKYPLFSSVLERGYQKSIRPRLWVRVALARISWIAFRLRQFFRPTRLSEKRDFLFVAKDKLALDYAVVQASMLMALPGIRIFITSPWSMQAKCEMRAMADGTRFIYLSFLDAVTRPWRLICFPSHFYGALFHAGSPKIFTTHGIQAGCKIFGGNNYAYSWKALRSPRRTYYDAMFAAHENERQIALADSWGRSLGPRIVVVGDPVATQLIRANECRDSIRSKLGVPQQAKVLLIISTWGENSLLKQMGTQLLGQMDKIAGHFTVFISAHPRCRLDREVSILLDRIQSSSIITVPTGPDSWRDYLAASDLAVSDRTSLSLYFALLNKPLAYIPIIDSSVLPESPLRELYDLCPRVNPDLPLAPQILGISREVVRPLWIKDFAAKCHEDRRFVRAAAKIAGIDEADQIRD